MAHSQNLGLGVVSVCVQACGRMLVGGTVAEWRGVGMHSRPIGNNS